MIPQLRQFWGSTDRRLREYHRDLPQPVQERTRRIWLSWVPVVQCALAAGIAWQIAHGLIGHLTPFFAPIAAVISLGLSLNQRLRRVFELVGGVVIGIGVGDVLISFIGSGTWQIMAVVALAMGAAVLVDRGPIIPMQAASSAVLVATLMPPGGGAGVSRMIDALIGGVVGIVVVMLVPVNPALRPRRDAANLLEVMRRVVSDVTDGIDSGDKAVIDAALVTARATQSQVDQLSKDAAGGLEVARMSPLYWSSRARMERLGSIAAPIDNAVRNVRVLARRASASVREGEKISPELMAELRGLAGAFGYVRDMVLADPGDHPDSADAARHLRTVARGARPEIVDGAGVSAIVIYAQVRSTLVDLLQVAGLQRVSAIALLPDRGSLPAPGEPKPGKP